jgi:hypothetical protein
VSLPFSENFQSTAPSANAAADYPAFTLSGSGSANVSASGVLNLVGSGATIDPAFTVTPNAAPTNEVIITADISAVDSFGNFNVGLIVGQNFIVFHPGYSGGAFRVDGIGGYGNTNMNFTPLNNILYRFEVHSFPDGLFTISVTDTANSITYNAPNFTNINSYGGEVGFLRSGNAGTGLYDNLSIVEVPEPSTLLLGMLAGLGFFAGRRRSRVTGK